MGGEASLRVFFGTYTTAKSKGIYEAAINPATGELGPPTLAAEVKNPTFLALNPAQTRLYAVSEVEQFEGKSAGGVVAFDIESHGLREINQQASGGKGPCHLAIDKTDSCVLVANYGSGSVAVLGLDASGALQGPALAVQHRGSSINPQRQSGPHAHFITTDTQNRFVLACDLGLDKLFVYRFDPKNALLTPDVPPAFLVKPGSGPRHLVFHPNGKTVYLVNEMASRLDVLAYNETSGTLQHVQSLGMLPNDFKGENLGAEVQVHPSGKFVFASNRGHNSIVVYKVISERGELELVKRESCEGRTPRHFVLTPDGRWMLVENQDSDNVAVFAVNARTGELKSTGQKYELGAPVCAVLMKPN